MDIIDLISPDRIKCDADVTSKKRALELLSEMLAASTETLPASALFNKLTGRERLGSTGLGHGVALPHARIEGSDKAVGALIKLEEGIDFDSFDKHPVDLLFALVVPEHFTDEHLKILADLAEMFSNEQLCESLRQANTPEDMYKELLHWQKQLKIA
ncbi:PTS sugar transporter subunit IIA [Alkalilimnicola ehrlichii]|uniref:PTS sugar transporter subunit IIA n=1 Tax=Alkalilimnicola ehrlichii TaxID=351052 RepID=A0A3E0X1B3_9GAMM|nr:PTS sugar transporter subunit IIA [Alkalilimnicola ehrlichii]RFA30387.1 PTS sugar transporter subunit IIA [Alkalilimnicola ehrlichii]RFA37957.1 PTS sugar transporter subunit IIA [Alkalilimnicola ehrlichii]